MSSWQSVAGGIHVTEHILNRILKCLSKQLPGLSWRPAVWTCPNVPNGEPYMLLLYSFVPYSLGCGASRDSPDILA